MSQGRVFQISVSKGGVPKLPVHCADIATEGLEGDQQNDREHQDEEGKGVAGDAHDRPFEPKGGQKEIHSDRRGQVASLEICEQDDPQVCRSHL